MYASPKTKKYFTALILFIILGGLAVYAPHYLTYSDMPIKSDGIVLILGPDFNAKKKKVEQLVAANYSKYLIIPGNDQIMTVSNKRVVASVKQNPSPHIGLPSKHKANRKFRIYENTHIEILRAKSLMDRLKFKSANFVSSPYHMRRIKIMSEKVFNPGYTLTFIPAPSAKAGRAFGFFKKSHLKRILQEYIKIAWFLLYDPFVDSGR